MSRHPLHRGPAAQDKELFGPGQLEALRAASHDLCWLLDRGYASRSALELVGNRHNLTSRQRMAVGRCACSVDAMEQRRRSELPLEELRGRELWIDGYNVLTVLESALSGGVVLLGRDRCCRDIAGIHSRYRKVNETRPALHLIGESTAKCGVEYCRWFLDKPISNSGRLRELILEDSAAGGWNATVELVFNPDRVLWETDHPIATADSVVLDRCRHWVNLTRRIISDRVPGAWVVDLSGDTS